MILVTGGTGFVGQEVVRELLSLGASVRLLVRNPERAAAFARHPRVQLAVGDALAPDTLPAAMAGVRAVINLIGIISETSRVTYDQAHTEATRNLLAAAKQAGVTRWVQMSAIGTRPHARSRYHQTKWQAEQLVRQSGLDWTILRPSLIYGYDHRDRILNLLRLFTSPPLDFLACDCFPLIDGGEHLIQPVSVREVARCFTLAPARETAIGHTFDLVGPAPMSWREMLSRFLAVRGRKALYEEIPLLLVLRVLGRLGLTLFPVLVLALLLLGRLGLATAEIAAGLWAVLLLLAARWRTILIVNLPGELLILSSEPLNLLAPRELRGSEMLKMAVEDNIGDPRPATETFNYTPETFEQGVKTLLSSA